LICAIIAASGGLSDSQNWKFGLVIIPFLVFTKHFFDEDGEPWPDSFRRSVISFMDPNLFFNAVNSIAISARDKLKALSILAKLEKQGRYGVQQALMEELSKNYSNKRKSMFGSALGLILFFIVAISNRLVLDLIYFPYIEPFLCNLHLLDCVTK
jgi:hypothetical protein